MYCALLRALLAKDVIGRYCVCVSYYVDYCLSLTDEANLSTKHGIESLLFEEGDTWTEKYLDRIPSFTTHGFILGFHFVLRRHGISQRNQGEYLTRFIHVLEFKKNIVESCEVPNYIKERVYSFCARILATAKSLNKLQVCHGVHFGIHVARRCYWNERSVSYTFLYCASSCYVQTSNNPGIFTLLSDLLLLSW